MLLWVDITNALLFSLDPRTGTVVQHALNQHTQHVTTVVPVAGSSSSVLLGNEWGWG